MTSTLIAMKITSTIRARRRASPTSSPRVCPPLMSVACPFPNYPVFKFLAPLAPPRTSCPFSRTSNFLSIATGVRRLLFDSLFAGRRSASKALYQVLVRPPMFVTAPQRLAQASKRCTGVPGDMPVLSRCHGGASVTCSDRVTSAFSHRLVI